MTLITSEMTEILFLLSSWDLQSSSGLFHDLLLFLGHLRFKKYSAKVMLDSFYLENQTWDSIHKLKCLNHSSK